MVQSTSVSRPVIAAVAALALLIGVVGAVGYAIGLREGSGPRIGELKVFRDVPAYTGDDQASATVDGITYGFFRDLTWIDSSGSFHERGWPDCLPQRSQTPVTFGGALVVGPTGVGSYRAMWVDCRK